jgi:uncharacterized protein (DUF488 family)
MGSKIVYTIGYGGWRLVAFVSVLRDLGVEVVVDVRRWTRSRRLPEYSGENLARALREAGLDYVWIPELGGYRRFGVDVEDYGVARCFESEGFRAYATYITRRGDVKPHLERLVEVASSRVVAVMCRERVPWLCHRKILSDYLVARGFKVLHILGPGRLVEHRLSRCAVVKNGELDYV